MIAKLEEGVLVTIKGSNLTYVHTALGYQMYVDDYFETKEDGSFYTYYNEDGTKDETKQQEVDDAIVKEEAKIAKAEALSKLTVTLEIGRALVFYADNEARQDLADAVLHSSPGDVTPWKLAEEFEGNRIIVVTHDELKEASMLALKAKGQLVGAV